MQAIEVLEEAAEAADADRVDDARAKLRSLIRLAGELAEAPAGQVDQLLIACGAARGLGSLADKIAAAVKAARAENVVEGPWEGSAVASIDAEASVTMALRNAGYPDVPDGLTTPEGYAITTARAWARHSREDEGDTYRPIGHDLCAVVGVAADAETDDIRLTLACRHRGRWTTLTVPRSTVLDGRKLIALTDVGVPVDGKSAPAMASWLAAQEAAMAERVAPVMALSRMGWSPDKAGFVLGERSIGARVIYSPPGNGEAQRAALYRESGTLAEWVRHIWEPCRAHPAGLVILAAFVPPLLPIMKAPGWTVDIGGITTSGKSTAQRLASSVWGYPDLTQWPTTWAAARNLMESCTHLPTILEDTKHAAKVPEIIKAVLYAAHAGRSQTLGAQGGGTRRERVISTVVISSGEAPAVEMCGDAQGATTRVLAIRRNPLPAGSKAIGDRLNDDANAFHGVPGRMVVEWLHHNRQFWPDIAAKYREMRDGLGATASDDLEARASIYVAQLHVAAWVVEAATGIVVPSELLSLALDCVRDGASDRDVPRRAMGWCLGWWASRPGMVWRGLSETEDARRKEIIGWELPAGRIAWSEPALREALEAGHFRAGEILTAWRARGWIEAGEAGRHTAKIPHIVDPKRPRGVILTAAAMEVGE